MYNLNNEKKVKDRKQWFLRPRFGPEAHSGSNLGPAPSGCITDDKDLRQSKPQFADFYIGKDYESIYKDWAKKMVFNKNK